MFMQCECVHIYVCTCTCMQVSHAMIADLSENTECCMAEMRLTNCVECTLNDWYYCMHVETRQHWRQLE